MEREHAQQLQYQYQLQQQQAAARAVAAEAYKAKLIAKANTPSVEYTQDEANYYITLSKTPSMYTRPLAGIYKLRQFSDKLVIKSTVDNFFQEVDLPKDVDLESDIEYVLRNEGYELVVKVPKVQVRYVIKKLTFGRPAACARQEQHQHELQQQRQLEEKQLEQKKLERQKKLEHFKQLQLQKQLKKQRKLAQLELEKKLREDELQKELEQQREQMKAKIAEAQREKPRIVFIPLRPSFEQPVAEPSTPKQSPVDHRSVPSSPKQTQVERRSVPSSPKQTPVEQRSVPPSPQQTPVDQKTVLSSPKHLPTAHLADEQATTTLKNYETSKRKTVFLPNEIHNDEYAVTSDSDSETESLHSLTSDPNLSGSIKVKKVRSPTIEDLVDEEFA